MEYDNLFDSFEVQPGNSVDLRYVSVGALVSARVSLSIHSHFRTADQLCGEKSICISC